MSLTKAFGASQPMIGALDEVVGGEAEGVGEACP